MNALAGWLLAATAATAATAAHAGAMEACDTDRAFAQEGWIIHGTEEFGGILRSALRRIDEEEDLGYTSSTRVHNPELDRPVVRIAFDQAKTPADTMMDDLVLFVDEETRALYEVRWFDGEHRHIAYATLSCANAPVPVAYNSMW